MQGILIFLRTNQGSRSEGVFPFLYRGYGKTVKVSLVGDNPFENTILRQYDGKPVAFEGELNDNGTFIATSVTELSSVELEAPPKIEFNFDQL